MFRRIHHRPPKLQKGSGAVKDRLSCPNVYGYLTYSTIRDMLAVIRMYEEDRNSRMKELAASEQVFSPTLLCACAHGVLYVRRCEISTPSWLRKSRCK